jgi:hypothetical protein
MLKVLESDFARLPDLLGRELPPPISFERPEPMYEPAGPAPAVQLGLF